MLPGVLSLMIIKTLIIIQVFIEALSPSPKWREGLEGEVSKVETGPDR
jgi:hypothetical protein